MLCYRASSLSLVSSYSRVPSCRILLLLLLCIILPSSGQRYAERNVLPADTFPSSDVTNDDKDYDYEEYGFDYDEEPNVYKWHVGEYPHPVNNPRFCNRMKASNVCDPDQVLEKEQADALDSFIQKLYKDTPCICDVCKKGDGGIVVGVAVLKHIFMPYNVHPSKVIRTFTERLRTIWNLSSCDNDILIVVATTDRLSYTDVGKATSEFLTVHEAHRIFLENKSKFSASNFSDGLMDILKGYYKATRAMEDVIARRKDDINMTMVSGIIVGCVILLGIILFVGFLLYRKYKINKESDSEDEEKPYTGKGHKASSSWSKKDMKELFGQGAYKAPHIVDTKYQKCGTDEADTKDEAEEEEAIDFTLATPDDTSFPNETQVTNVTSDSVNLEEDLNEAAEGIVRTFPIKDQKVLISDM